MIEDRYGVMLYHGTGSGDIIAHGMRLNDALLLCRALLEEYNNEPVIAVSIIRKTTAERETE